MLKKILINYFIDFSRLGMDFLNKSRIYVMGFIDKNGCLYNKLSDMGKNGFSIKCVLRINFTKIL